MEQRLIDAGHDPDDVEELLYDPAPRRRGKKYKARRSSRVQRVRAPTYVYDPAPKKRKVTARRTRKGVLAKLKPYVLPGTAGVTFYAAYLARATELFNAGTIAKNDVFLAIQYDIMHLDANAAMGRLQTNAINIATPAIGGFLVKTTHIAGKWSGVLGDLLYGFAVGTGAKVVLDPPVNAPAARRSTATKTVTATQQNGCPGCDQTPTMMREYNPYMPGGY